MAEALAAFEAGARSDGHTPDSGLRFRLFHPSFCDRLTHLPLGMGASRCAPIRPVPSPSRYKDPK